MKYNYSAGVILCLAGSAVAQTALYSNGSVAADVPALGLSPTTTSGVIAPGGSLYSETSGTTSDVNIFAGFACYKDVGDPAGTYRVSDGFHVNQEHGWSVDSVTFYIYVPGYTGTTSPLSGANVRLWDGRPGDEGTQVLWGNVTSNKLISAVRTNNYRVFNTRAIPVGTPTIPPNTQRRIWEVKVSLDGVTLPLGNYYFDVQLTCANPAHQTFAIPATVPGQRAATGTTPHADAVTFAPASIAGAWTPMVDPGKPFLATDAQQELAFVINGEAHSYPCPADYNLDGGIDGSDVGEFFADWSNAETRADVNYDGGVDGADVAIFFEAWGNGGC